MVFAVTKTIDHYKICGDGKIMTDQIISQYLLEISALYNMSNEVNRIKYSHSNVRALPLNMSDCSQPYCELTFTSPTYRPDHAMQLLLWQSARVAEFYETRTVCLLQPLFFNDVKAKLSDYFVSIIISFMETSVNIFF